MFVDVEAELQRILPLEIPNRAVLIEKGARHCRLIAETNEFLNLTRITSPEEAAVKHVYDSVAPWRHFMGARKVLDAGTGAGFPGIPLAIVLPDVRFTLSESIAKKSRFVDSAVELLHLPNVRVSAQRAEDITSACDFDIITARAVAPMPKLLDFFSAPLKRGAKLILYKGPDVQNELAAIRNGKVIVEVLSRYDLPRNFGFRTIVEVRAKSAGRESLRKPATATPR